MNYSISGCSSFKLQSWKREELVKSMVIMSKRPIHVPLNPFAIDSCNQSGFELLNSSLQHGWSGILVPFILFFFCIVVFISSHQTIYQVWPSPTVRQSHCAPSGMANTKQLTVGGGHFPSYSHYLVVCTQYHDGSF